MNIEPTPVGIRASDPLDLIIVGGGPAGMSAALVAGRALLRTVIVNAEDPRNAATTASHGFLTRDGVHPTELLELSKSQMSKYETVRYVHGTVTGVGKLDEGGFGVDLNDQTPLAAERIIIATGHRDDLASLRLPGIEDVYGRSVYPCVFCDGFEHRHQRIAVFDSQAAGFYTPMVRLWSTDIVVFTNGTDMDDEKRRELEGRSIRVVETPVTRLLSDDGVLRAVELDSGELIERDAGFISDDYSHPATTFTEELGVATKVSECGMPAPEADDTGKTKTPGVYVVGDARIGFAGLIASAAEGAYCAENIVHEIANERWATAEDDQPVHVH